MTRRDLFILAVSATLAISWLIGAEGADAHDSRQISRCGFVGSPYGRLGVYIAKGHVSCGKGRRLIHREFYVAGKSVGTGSVLYPDGWVCGGQMGSYFCAKPFWSPPAHPKQYVAALACHLGSGPTTVRCPRRIRLQVP